MKFYIASSLSNYEKVSNLSCPLKNAGWEHTFDWTLQCHVKEIVVETLKAIVRKEYEGQKKLILL